MMDNSFPSETIPQALQTLNLSLEMDVPRRLADLRDWTESWQMEDQLLRQQVECLAAQQEIGPAIGIQTFHLLA